MQNGKQRWRWRVFPSFKQLGLFARAGILFFLFSPAGCVEDEERKLDGTYAWTIDCPEAAGCATALIQIHLGRKIEAFPADATGFSVTEISDNPTFRLSEVPNWMDTRIDLSSLRVTDETIRYDLTFSKDLECGRPLWLYLRRELFALDLKYSLGCE